MDRNILGNDMVIALLEILLFDIDKTCIVRHEIRKEKVSTSG